MLYNRIIGLIKVLRKKCSVVELWDEDFLKIIFKDMLILRIDPENVVI